MMVGCLSLQSDSGMDGLPLELAMLSQTATASGSSPRAISIAVIAMQVSRLYIAVETEQISY